MGMACDSLIGLDKALTVEFTSAGTLKQHCHYEMSTSREYTYCINEIRGKMNLPSKGVKFKHCGFIGNPIFLALEL